MECFTPNLGYSLLFVLLREDALPESRPDTIFYPDALLRFPLETERSVVVLFAREQDRELHLPDPDPNA